MMITSDPEGKKVIKEFSGEELSGAADQSITVFRNDFYIQYPSIGPKLYGFGT